MKKFLFTILKIMAGLIPAKIRKIVMNLWLEDSLNKEPKEALISLFEILDEVEWKVNQNAIRLGQGVHVKHRLMRYHDFFVERIGPNDKVLDIGCGYGAVANSIAKGTKAHITGIDLNEKSIQQARDHYQLPNLTWIHGDAFKDLPNEKYDIIVLSNVLEHIEHRVDFLMMIQQRIHPKKWLIRVPMYSRHWMVPLREEIGVFPYSDPTHFTEFTIQSFQNETSEAGLEIIYLTTNWGEIWAEIVPRNKE